MTSENLIEVQDLSFYRGDKCILSNINLSIPRGKITAIMGPSGCGKTTLLSLLGGLLKPQSGNVLYNGVVLNQLKRQALYELRKEIGVLFQSGALFTDLSVYENVAFPIREHANLPESMVRNIVGVLMAVGSERKPESWVAELLEAKDRSKAAETAPPYGLYLTEVSYPSHYEIPEMTSTNPLLVNFQTINNSVDS